MRSRRWPPATPPNRTRTSRRPSPCSWPAREIGPDLQVDATTGPLIVDICNRLDGLPLAIELAAVRLRLFSLQALHDRLTQRLPVLVGGARDLPERQQALRATIAWS